MTVSEAKKELVDMGVPEAHIEAVMEPVRPDEREDVIASISNTLFDGLGGMYDPRCLSPDGFIAW